MRSRWDFLLARAVQRGRVLQAGEYRFDHAASPLEVVDRIARGDVFYYTLVAPEGKNMFDLAQAAAQTRALYFRCVSGGGAQPRDDSRSRPARAIA